MCRILALCKIWYMPSYWLKMLSINRCVVVKNIVWCQMQSPESPYVDKPMCTDTIIMPACYFSILLYYTSGWDLFKLLLVGPGQGPKKAHFHLVLQLFYRMANKQFFVKNLLETIMATNIRWDCPKWRHITKSVGYLSLVGICIYNVC